MAGKETLCGLGKGDHVPEDLKCPSLLPGSLRKGYVVIVQDGRCATEYQIGIEGGCALHHGWTPAMVNKEDERAAHPDRSHGPRTAIVSTTGDNVILYQWPPSSSLRSKGYSTYCLSDQNSK